MPPLPKPVCPILALVAMLSGPATWAQDAALPPFPAEARLLEGPALDTHVRGKVFEGTAADGRRWRLEFSTRGYLFVNVDPSFADDGPFEVKGSQICVSLQRRGPSCGEYRAGDGLLYLQRKQGMLVLKAE